MTNRGGVSESRERIAHASEGGTETISRQQWLKVFGVFWLLFVVAVAAGIALSGCGQRSETQTQAQAVAPDAGSQPVTAAVASMPGPVAGTSTSRDSTASDALPPDVTVSMPDTLVDAGSALELVAEGTSDVKQIVLSDGLNDPQAFVRDEGTNVWRTTYRVPLRPRLERFGLSVTARNEADRWRRVWVFVHVQKDGQEACDNPDEIGSEK
jgi:hypothetical protein